jgi:Caspase domain
VEGRRVALLIATDRYLDTGLSKLAAPANDAKRLAAVLRRADIAGFEVKVLHNRRHHVVGMAIGDFYRDRRREDLTLLYFTGHGIKDDYGQLYLAMTDTKRDNLQFTGLQGEHIRVAMEECRSRQNVLVLDCCYAGAFPAGRGVKGDMAVHTTEQLGGRGCVVLTSSDATQYSFEGNQLTQTGSPSFQAGSSSLFTRFLIEGLKTGQADLNGDGDITLDELYSYVHDHVTAEQPQQHPKKKDDVEGRIMVAQNRYWTLPSHINDAINGPYLPSKLAALQELSRRYSRGNAIVQQRVLEKIYKLADDDSKQVSGAAHQFLSSLIQEKEAKRDAEAQAKRDAEAQAKRDAEAQAKRDAEAQAKRDAEAQAKRDAEAQEAATGQPQKIADLQADMRRHAVARRWSAVVETSAQIVRLDPAAADPYGLATTARKQLAKRQSHRPGSPG